MKIKYKFKDLTLKVGDKVKVNFDKEGCIELLKKYTLPTGSYLSGEFTVLDLNSSWHPILQLPAVKVSGDTIRDYWLIPKELLIKCS